MPTKGQKSCESNFTYWWVHDSSTRTRGCELIDFISKKFEIPDSQCCVIEGCIKRKYDSKNMPLVEMNRSFLKDWTIIKSSESSSSCENTIRQKKAKNRGANKRTPHFWPRICRILTMPEITPFLGARLLHLQEPWMFVPAGSSIPIPCHQRARLTCYCTLQRPAALMQDRICDSLCVQVLLVDCSFFDFLYVAKDITLE